MTKRFFIEVSYKGTKLSGFQIQKEAPTVQGFIQEALFTLLKRPIALQGASRTDAGVHAIQNYFHFDTDCGFEAEAVSHSLNSILPREIAIKRIFEVANDMHARFSALYREYNYYIIDHKNPFYTDTAYLYFKKLDLVQLNLAAKELCNHKDFTTFSKLHTQVYTNDCDIMLSQWSKKEDLLMYHVKANRFLRGMVRALVGTMLKVGTGAITLDDFRAIILSKNCGQAYFDAPAKGLFLAHVAY